MPIEAHLHHDPFWSMVVVFGVDLALPLLLALVLVITGLRREGDERGAYLGLARWSVIACLLMQLLSVGYHARLFAGTAEQGTVTQQEAFPNAKQPHCDLTLETAHGSLEVAVEHGRCRELPVGTSVPVVTVASSTMFAQVGERATVHVASLLLGAFLLALLLIAWMLVRSASRIPSEPQS